MADPAPMEADAVRKALLAYMERRRIVVAVLAQRIRGTMPQPSADFSLRVLNSFLKNDGRTSESLLIILRQFVASTRTLVPA